MLARKVPEAARKRRLESLGCSTTYCVLDLSEQACHVCENLTGLQIYHTLYHGTDMCQSADNLDDRLPKVLKRTSRCLSLTPHGLQLHHVVRA
jgi:hypothetical protein